MGRADSNQLDWDRYVRAVVSESQFGEAQRRCQAALAEQRKTIGELIRDLRPRRIGCLGSGYLIDIPIEDLCEHAEQSFLVDWVADISLEGVRRSIIQETSGGYSCLFCHAAAPERFCAGYRGSPGDRESVCEAFRPAPEPSLSCGNYEPGSQPAFMTHDVTAGIATEFARRAAKLMPRSRTPEDAFKKAIVACRASAKTCDRIPIEDGSLDLVTSSMVASQFDAEPYTYFANILERRFGRDPLLAREGRLRSLMERLRSELFKIQMEGHARELHRLVAKQKGIVYFSVELFRSLGEGESYFLVHEIPRAMEILGKFFFFDFARSAPEVTLRPARMGNSISIIQSYVLRPNPNPDAAMN